jgi:hypothetical protein
MRLQWTTGILLFVGINMMGFGASTYAQSSNGYVGIYRDSSGTVAYHDFTVYRVQPLYVIAKTAGITDAGLTGAEFRIEVTNPSGWYFNYSGPSGANVVLGNLLILIGSRCRWRDEYQFPKLSDPIWKQGKTGNHRGIQCKWWTNYTANQAS